MIMVVNEVYNVNMMSVTFPDGFLFELYIHF